MFTEKEKLIYQALDGRLFDPLRVDRLLTIHSGNRLRELVALRNPETIESGDVSKAGRAKAEVEACRAELELAAVAREAFELAPFPDCTDAQALDLLYHFLEWLAGKDAPAGTPPSQPTTAAASSSRATTTS